MAGDSDDEDGLHDSVTVVASDEILRSEVDGESVILDQKSEVYYGINEVGSHLWRQIQEPRTVKELVESTTAKYDVAREECRDDVEEFLTDLLESDLIERV
jgi:hypothetical protein